MDVLITGMAILALLLVTEVSKGMENLKQKRKERKIKESLEAKGFIIKHIDLDDNGITIECERGKGNEMARVYIYSASSEAIEKAYTLFEA